MKTEFELKVLEIDVLSMVEKLEKLGAKKRWEKFFRRYVYDFTPPKENSRVRLRTDGSQTTLTIKEITNDDIDGTKERETAVECFEITHQILNKLWYTHKAYQENRRTSYLLGKIELEIDQRPMIPPYLEIEAQDKESVLQCAKKLGFVEEQLTAINTKKVYQKYWIDIQSIKELRFD